MAIPARLSSEIGKTEERCKLREESMEWTGLKVTGVAEGKKQRKDSLLCTSLWADA